MKKLRSQKSRTRYRPEYIPDNAEEWVYKCAQCQHCYCTKDDPDEWKCASRTGCNFKPYKIEVSRDE